MKKTFLGGSFLLLYFISPAQHTEFSAGVNAGFLSFRGSDAVSSSYIIQSDVGEGNYVNDPYSKKSGAGIGLDITVQRITKSKFIYGFSTGLEFLKHNVPVTSVEGIGGSYKVAGKIAVNSKFINLSPTAGYRFLLSSKLTLDIMAGINVAVGLGNFHETGSVTTSTDNVITVDKETAEVPTDLRLGGQTRLSYKNFSLIACYWAGQTNYYKGYIGGSPESYSNLFRLGLSYRLNKGK